MEIIEILIDAFMLVGGVLKRVLSGTMPCYVLKMSLCHEK